MTTKRPADHLDELYRLRVGNEPGAVEALASSIWTVWADGELTDSTGIAAVCQVAFISSMGAEAYADAQLWRARGCSAAVQTGELNTMAMLLIPLSFAANDMGYTDAALRIVEEVGRLADEIERRGGMDAPGPPFSVVRRAQHEKRGYLMWRNSRYTEALASYRMARPYAPAGTRDAIRVAAGELLSELGVEEQESGTFDGARARDEFRRLADDAAAHKWMDVAEPLTRNADVLSSGGTTGVQDLEPVEIEKGPFSKDDSAL